MTAPTMSPLFRSSQYLYLAPLFARKRVLEVGCGSGEGCRQLLAGDAARVVGIDQTQASVKEASANVKDARVQFQVAEYANLEFDDGSFDVVVAPSGGALSSWLGFLEEARRVLAPGGVLVLAVRADKGARGYVELVERLEPMFGRVRMVAMAPFRGWSLVEYASDDDSEEIEDMVLDTSLAPDSIEPGFYVAVAGQLAGGAGDRPWPLSIVQLPGSGEAEAPAQPAKSEAATEAPQKREPAKVDDRELTEARKKLRTREEDLARTMSDNQGLRWRVSELEGLVADRSRAQPAPASAPAPVPQQQARQEAPAADGVSLDRLAEVATLHEQAMQESREALEERDAYIEELRAELEAARSESQEHTAKLEEQDSSAARVDQELREIRARCAQAEGQLLKQRLAGGSAPTEATSQAATPQPGSRSAGGNGHHRADPGAAEAVRYLSDETASILADLRRRVEAGNKRLRVEIMDIIGAPGEDTGEPMSVLHAELEAARAELARTRGSHSGGGASASSDSMDELDEVMAILAAGLREEELRLEDIERGLGDVRRQLDRA